MSVDRSATKHRRDELVVHPDQGYLVTCTLARGQLSIDLLGKLGIAGTALLHASFQRHVTKAIDLIWSEREACTDVGDA